MGFATSSRSFAQAALKIRPIPQCARHSTTVLATRRWGGISISSLDLVQICATAMVISQQRPPRPLAFPDPQESTSAPGLLTDPLLREASTAPTGLRHM